MNESEYPHTFRIVGPTSNPRKRVNATTAFNAYCQCDPRARVDHEAYLGVFSFGESFVVHLGQTGSTRGFTGPASAAHVWFDIDRDKLAGGIERAIADAGRLTAVLDQRYGVPVEYLLPFISGSKGVHVGLPTALLMPGGSQTFHLEVREFASRIASAAGVAIDEGIYDRVRAFRAPNSRHPKTGLHKRFIPPEQFQLLTLEDAMTLAAKPQPFELQDLSGCGPFPALAAEWHNAAEAVSKRQKALEDRRRDIENGMTMAPVNRHTIDLIRGEPIAVGDRHRMIYAAARNLADAGAPLHLVRELLREPALDTGLPPREVDRQLDCGFSDAIKKTKAELYNHLYHKNGTIFYNKDNPILSDLVKGFKNTISYGENNADITGHSVISSPYIDALVNFPAETRRLKTKLTGRYNFENVLAAACIGNFFKVEPARIQTAVMNYTPLSNRSQLIEKNELKKNMQGELEQVRKVLVNKECDLLILDEIMAAIHGELLSVEDACALIDLRPPGMEMVLTGRSAPNKLIERADLVTEMRCIKHYMDKGVTARKGIEK